MAWIEPKTNWASTDFFNASDYNRIRGNLLYLADFSQNMFPSVVIGDLGVEKVIGDLIYAREVNAFETALETLNKATYNFDIGEKAVYRDNGATPLWSEWNRIESALLILHSTMVSHFNVLHLQGLPFRLGNQKGIKV